MTVFNSLGSNYSFGFALKSLFGKGAKGDMEFIKQKLGQEFGGKVTLTYKGRHALELALKNSGLPAGSKIAINGFTCYAVYRAVERAGFESIFIDVASDELNFGLSELKKAKDIKAVIIQNTLGLPSDAPVIKKYCKEQKILIIEDLAHSYGAVYEDGTNAGQIGDLIMLSFSQDKQQDVVAAGALIDRRKIPAEIEQLPPAESSSQIKNRFYPILSHVVRGCYNLGFGKYIHYPLKKLNVLATPMADNNENLADMTPLAAHLLKKRLLGQKKELAHRKEIASIYHDQLPKDMQYKVVGQPSYLRFPIKAKDPGKLIQLLADYDVFIGDTWYDSPIAPKSYMKRTSYKQGDCPRAEDLTKQIVNLPTHQHIDPEIAYDICATIRKIELRLNQ